MNALTVNRRRLSDIIFDLETFTEQELLEEFSQDRNGDIVIDGEQTVSEYLELLKDIGVLHYEDGRYSISKNGR